MTMNDGFANIVSAVQIGNDECCYVQTVDGRGGGGESFGYGIYRTARKLRKFVDLYCDMDGDKSVASCMEDENIRTATIYLRRSFQVIYARSFTDCGNYSRE